MRLIASALALTIVSGAADAEETTLTEAEIKQLLTDHVLKGDNWEQIFQKSGATFYATGGAQSQGFWEVRGNQYCSNWPPGPAWACYDITRDGDTYTFVSKDGQRTPSKVLK
jgi:hypothetical protein